MARIKYYNPTTQQWEYADSNPLPTGKNGDIIVNENGVWVAKPKWQMIYQPVEYIESTGTQRIVTDIYPSASTRAVVQESYADLTTYSLEGESANEQYFTWGITSRKEYFETRVGGSSAQWRISAVPIDTSVHTWDIQSGSQKIDDTTIATDTMISASTPLALFARLAGDWEYTKVKLFYCKLYESGTLVRDYIPVRNVFTGEGGLYDTVDGVFYANAGTGTFLKGADV